MHFVLYSQIESFYIYRPQRSCGKVMFSQASVILFTGMGNVADTPWQITPPLHPGRHPPGRHPPLGRHSIGQTTPGLTPPCPVHAGIHTPLPSACWDTHPPAQCMLGYTPDLGGHCSGRYASYWNAFLV